MEEEKSGEITLHKSNMLEEQALETMVADVNTQD